MIGKMLTGLTVEVKETGRSGVVFGAWETSAAAFLSVAFPGGRVEMMPVASLRPARTVPLTMGAGLVKLLG